MMMMDHVKGRSSNKTTNSSSFSSTPTQCEEDMSDLRRGPWTDEEDFKLINYIASHGDGRWNSLARSAGLKRTGKSCRLRWLNYLRPDVRRGNITLEEQLKILELHSLWGNRWSKIAQHLPGRTDNEIKNYWRTRVQKHAKQLKCDVNSKQFKDTMKYLWVPRLIERIQAASAANTSTTTNTAISTATTTAAATVSPIDQLVSNSEMGSGQWVMNPGAGVNIGHEFGIAHNISPAYTPPETSASSDSLGTQQVSDLTNDYYSVSVDHQHANNNQDYFQSGQVANFSESMISPCGYLNQVSEFQSMDQNHQLWLDGGDTSDNFWNVEDIWFNNI